jgi:hypothetical protein
MYYQLRSVLREQIPEAISGVTLKTTQIMGYQSTLEL